MTFRYLSLWEGEMKRSLITAIALWCVAGIGPARAQEKMPPTDCFPYETAPEAIKQVQPKYPDAARKDSAEGTVWLKVWIDEQGTAAKVNVQKSDAKIFDQSAIAAAKQWTFKPALKDGKPVAVWVTIPFRFKLMDSDKAQSPPAPMMMKSKRYPPAEDVKCDKEPESISQVMPHYPDQAFQSGLEGTVWTKMWIDESGHVVEVIVSKSENPIFNEAAMEAGMQWVFKPALENGKPIAVWITVPFRFAIGPK
jgi:TonB family protein